MWFISINVLWTLFFMNIMSFGLASLVLIALIKTVLIQKGNFPPLYVNFSISLLVAIIMSFIIGAMILEPLLDSSELQVHPMYIDYGRRNGAMYNNSSLQDALAILNYAFQGILYSTSVLELVTIYGFVAVTDPQSFLYLMIRFRTIFHTACYFFFNIGMWIVLTGCAIIELRMRDLPFSYAAGGQALLNFDSGIVQFGYFLCIVLTLIGCFLSYLVMSVIKVKLHEVKVNVLTATSHAKTGITAYVINQAILFGISLPMVGFTSSLDPLFWSSFISPFQGSNTDPTQIYYGIGWAIFSVVVLIMKIIVPLFQFVMFGSVEDLARRVPLFSPFLLYLNDLLKRKINLVDLKETNSSIMHTKSGGAGQSRAKSLNNSSIISANVIASPTLARK